MSIGPLRVEKIGGTSMSRFGEIVDNIILRDKHEIYNRVYVVSAYAGVTNALLEHKKSGRPGIYRRFEEHKKFRTALAEMKGRLCDINAGLASCGLDVEVANEFIRKRMDASASILRSMNAVLASGYLDRTALLLAARELLASIGEMHSAFNSACVLRARGYDATFVDLSGWEDGRELSIDERIRDVFEGIDPTGTICFATGYTKGTEGIMREFDRGYSEVTFSKVAVLLGATEAVIHKEFHLCSGDPNLIGEDRVTTVGATNFDVADQLADVGMEAIHPRASKPLELSGVPIRIKNAFDPEHPGTLITKQYLCPESRTEIVTGSNAVMSIAVHDTKMVGEVGFDLHIMEVLRQFDVSYVAKMTNANTIDMLLDEHDCSDGLVAALTDAFELVTVTPVAVVCAIGSNIAKPGVLALAASALAAAEINILALTQTSRQTNVQFVVTREHFESAQRALHRALCE